MSKKHERRYHETIAVETASWTSWAVGSWWTNGNMALMPDEPFTGTAMRLEYECSCPTDDDQRDHRHDLTRSCVFVDLYRPDQPMVDRLSNTLEASLRHRGNKVVEIDRQAFGHPEAPEILCYRARVPDEAHPKAWLAIQAKYVEAIEKYARPDRWAWFQMSAIGEPVKSPVLWALRGARNQGVGLIMPAACPGSAVELCDAEPTYTGAAS